MLPARHIASCAHRLQEFSVDKIDGFVLIPVNIIMLVAIACYFWGASALLVAALIGTPLALGAVVALSLTAKA